MNKLVSAGIGGLLCISPAVHATERPSAIPDRLSAFHSDIRIGANGELAVIETIEVQSNAREAPRGIVRELPGDYRDRLGNRVTVPLAVDRVLRNGRPEQYVLERAPNGARVRTGERGRALPRGKHVYQIAYRTARQVGFREAHDELYWEVTRGLGAAVERLSAEVSFEGTVPASTIKVDASTGPEDARGDDYHAFVRHGSAAFRATRPLSAREGMTILVEFPKGVVERPTHLERGAWYLSSNRGVPVGAAIIGLMLALLLACRWRFLRAPTPAPAGEPPAGVGAGAVRFIDRGGYDERCLGAAILGLQSRGYLRVRDHGERLRLERTGVALEWFPGEETLARRLVRERPADIRRHGRTLEEAGIKLARELKAAYGARRWVSHLPFAYAAAGIGITAVLAMHALATPPLPFAVLCAATALSFLLFAFKLLPLREPRGRAHSEAIEALRRHLAGAEPRDEEEFVRLLPYAVALDLENAWGRCFAEKLPANIVELTPRAPDKARARPRRPLPHKRSAAA